MSNSRVPILYHESKSIQWVLVYTMSSSLYHEFKSIPWVLLYTISPSLFHDSKSIPWILLYTMSLSVYNESKSIPWIPVYISLKGLGKNLISQGKKSNFTSEQILFQIRTNPILQFDMWKNRISHIHLYLHLHLHLHLYQKLGIFSDYRKH